MEFKKSNGFEEVAEPVIMATPTGIKHFSNSEGRANWDKVMKRASEYNYDQLGWNFEFSKLPEGLAKGRATFGISRLDRRHMVKQWSRRKNNMVSISSFNTILHMIQDLEDGFDYSSIGITKDLLYKAISNIVDSVNSEDTLNDILLMKYRPELISDFRSPSGRIALKSDSAYFEIGRLFTFSSETDLHLYKRLTDSQLDEVTEEIKLKRDKRNKLISRRQELIDNVSYVQECDIIDTINSMSYYLKRIEEVQDKLCVYLSIGEFQVIIAQDPTSEIVGRMKQRFEMYGFKVKVLMYSRGSVSAFDEQAVPKPIIGTENKKSYTSSVVDKVTDIKPYYELENKFFKALQDGDKELAGMYLLKQESKSGKFTFESDKLGTRVLGVGSNINIELLIDSFKLKKQDVVYFLDRDKELARKVI